MSRSVVAVLLLLFVTQARNAEAQAVNRPFEAGAQLLINGESVQLDSSGTTELVGRFTNAMLAAPGELMIQVRNATGKTSNTFRLAVVSRQ